MFNGSTSLVVGMTRDVIFSTFHPSAAAVNDEPATANKSLDVRHLPASPPIDASSFDYVYPLEDLSSLRQRWSDDPAFMPTAVVYGLAFVFGFLGNLFVALALIVDRRQRAVLAAADGGGSHHLSFLVSLAIADVLFLLVCLPYELVIKLESVWRGGLALCKLAGFIEMITATASVLNLSAVSIERFDGILVFSFAIKRCALKILIALEKSFVILLMHGELTRTRLIVTQRNSTDWRKRSCCSADH